MTPLCLAVVEADVVEVRSRPSWRRKLRRTGPVDDVVALRHHLHAVIDRADVLEQRRHFPHDPLRHAVDAQHKADRDGDRADRDAAVQPEPDRQRRDRRTAATQLFGIDSAWKHRDQAHLTGARSPGTRPCLPWHRSLPGRACENSFTVCDVGVAVDDAAGHHRARIRLLRRRSCEAAARSSADDADIDAEPGEERHHQPPVGRPR